MRWAVFVIVVALAAFAVSAFVSRDKTCTGSDSKWYSSGRTCVITYWWD